MKKKKQAGYKAILESAPCKTCGQGESWTVIGPTGVGVSQSWAGEESQLEAEAHARELNRAFYEGRKSR